jgi:GMP synthase-like glutamine amidotransferase
MSKALGGKVTRNPQKEIGWCELTVDDNPQAAAWFGSATKSFIGFEWHGDAFSLPPGAVRLLSSPQCVNQAFALGPHLGMQCHVEMDGQLVRDWCASGEQEIAEAGGSGVQSTAEIQRDLDARLAHLNGIADRLYQRWVASLDTN